MIKTTKIADSLFGIVGFRQPNNPKYTIIDDDNQGSTSGYFITDCPYAKVEFIKDNQDYLDLSDAEFNVNLKNMQKASISSVCNQVFSDFDFIDRNLLFKNASNKAVTEELPIGFVGYKIEVSDDKNMAFCINRILADFAGTGFIKLLMWNTAKRTAIFEKEVEITTDHQEIVLNWELDNSDSTYKGDFYIGYIADILDVEPFKRQFNNANVMTKFKNLCIEKVFVPDHVTENLFDLTMVHGLSQDIGLNLDITVYEDFTDLVINNRNLFAKAVNTHMIIQCMQLYVATIRSNRNQMFSETLYEKVIAELEGTSPESVIRVKGMKPQLIGEITSIRKEILKLKKGFFKTGQILSTTLE